MSEDSILDEFGKQELAPFNYADLIDRDKIARNDFFYFKQGYILGQSKALDDVRKEIIHLKDLIERVKPWVEQYVCFEDPHGLIEQWLKDAGEDKLDNGVGTSE